MVTSREKCCLAVVLFTTQDGPDLATPLPLYVLISVHAPMVGLIPNQHSNSGLTPRDRPAIYCICVGLVQQHSMHSEPHVYPDSGQGPLVSLLVMYTVRVSVYAAPSGLCSSPCMQFGGYDAPVLGRPVGGRDMPGTPEPPREMVMVIVVPTAQQPSVAKASRAEETPHSNHGFLGFSRKTSLVQYLLDGMLGLCRETTPPPPPLRLNTLPNAAMCHIPVATGHSVSRGKKLAGFRIPLHVSLACSHPFGS